MNYDKAKVTIDLDEYNELLRIKKMKTADNSGALSVIMTIVKMFSNRGSISDFLSQVNSLLNNSKKPYTVHLTGVTSTVRDDDDGQRIFIQKNQ